MTNVLPIIDADEDLGGDQLTRLKKRRTNGDVSANLRLFAEMHSPENLESYISELAAECAAILRKKDLPAPTEIVQLLPNGTWRLVDLEPPASGCTAARAGTYTGAHYVQTQYQPFSSEWYAAKIGELCALISSAKDRADSVYHMWLLELGALSTDRQWRQRHKKNILTGRAVRAGGRYGGANRARGLLPTTRAIILQMKQLKREHSILTINQIAERAFKSGFGTSASANRKLWYRHKRKKL